MKRLFLCLILLAGLQAQAQYYKTDTSARRGFDPSRLIIGGSLGLIFGDYTNVNISPLVGYRFSDMFAAGVSINAQYASEKERDYYTDRTLYRYTYTVFGGGLWGRFYPLEMLFLHAQPEYNFVSEKMTDYTGAEKQTYKSNYGVPSLLLGGGYSQPVGGNSAFYIMLLYDVLQDDRSPYQNRPLFRAGVNVGF